MYGKVFASMFEGSLVGAGPVVFAVWSYILAMAGPNDEVAINNRLLATILGCTEGEVEKALERLSSPDPASRSTDEDGRRIVPIGLLSWRIVNHDKYWNINVGKRRNGIKHSNPVRRGYERPTAAQVQEYLDSIGEDGFTGQQFVDFYESTGWVRGANKIPIKDWRAAVRTWRYRQAQPKSNLRRAPDGAPAPAPTELVEDRIDVDPQGREREVRIWRDANGREIRRRWGNPLA